MPVMLQPGGVIGGATAPGPPPAPGAPATELSPGLASAIAAAAAVAAGQPQAVNAGQLSANGGQSQQQQQQGGMVALGGMMQGTMARGSMMGQKAAVTMRGGDLQSRIAAATRPTETCWRLFLSVVQGCTLSIWHRRWRRLHD